MLGAVHWLIRLKSKETVFPDGERERQTQRDRAGYAAADRK